MKFLFVHQNFPGQYQHIVRHLTDQPGNQIVFITQANENAMSGVTKVVYDTPRAMAGGPHPFVAEFDNGVRNGLAVAQACRVLEAQGFRPDIVVGHNGWGEILFIKDVWPDVPLLGYFEFFYRVHGSDMNFDPEYPSVWIDGPRVRAKNTVNMAGLDTADRGQTPTRWQWSQYPANRRRRVSIVHEGIDTKIAKPNPKAWVDLARQNIRLTSKDEVITYVARNLEPYRGFHIFMRALPEILRRRPKARVLIVGGDEVSYGAPAPNGKTYREILLEEVGDRLDMNRVHFLGKIPHQAFIGVLQISSVHVYLTYPFVLSWSFLEAMSAGCAVIGSATPPVMEVLKDGENGLLVDFFDTAAIADKVDQILDHPDRMKAMRKRARQTVVDSYDLHSVALPKMLALIEDVVNGKLDAAPAKVLRSKRPTTPR